MPQAKLNRPRLRDSRRSAGVVEKHHCRFWVGCHLMYHPLAEPERG
jgi:hypothetical protein